ncbi:MAG: DNA-binding response regulator, partial [Alphaproteobacteria bacterium]
MLVSGHDHRIRVHPEYLIQTTVLMTQPDTATIPVYIVEDDAQMREGLQWMIDASPGFVCAGAYGACENAIEAWTRMPPPEGAVILMDIGLPGISGVAGTRLIRERWPHVQVLMLTM